MGNKTDAIEIITYAEENGIKIWIYGGCGIDVWKHTSAVFLKGKEL